MDYQNFEWSPNGLTLLLKIKQEIKSNGGNLQCCVAIEREWGILSSADAGNKKFWSAGDEYYLVNNFSNTGLGDMSKILNRSPDAIMSKYFRLTK